MDLLPEGLITGISQFFLRIFSVRETGDQWANLENLEKLELW